jgi:hypothetical protein
MATLTNWQAERGGLFQGAPTPGQGLGRFVDWVLAKVGKLPKLPKPEPNKDHWTTWGEGEPISVTDAWLDEMIRDGKLPVREGAQYQGVNKDRAEMLVMSGSHVIVEMLDTDRKTRRRCKLAGTVLMASRQGWEASLRAV